MDLILIFFVFPLVTIILSAVLEFIIKCPIAVAAVAFSVWVLVAFLVFDTTTFFVAVFIYTLLAFITAIIVKFIRCNIKSCKSCKSCDGFSIAEIATAGLQDTITEAVNDAVNEVVPEAVNEAINNLLAVTCGCGCNNNLNNNLGCGCNNNSNNNLGCGCNNNSNNNSGCGRSKTYRFKR